MFRSMDNPSIHPLSYAHQQLDCEANRFRRIILTSSSLGHSGGIPVFSGQKRYIIAHICSSPSPLTCLENLQRSTLSLAQKKDFSSPFYVKVWDQPISSCILQDVHTSGLLCLRQRLTHNPVPFAGWEVWPQIQLLSCMMQLITWRPPQQAYPTHTVNNFDHALKNLDTALVLVIKQLITQASLAFHTWQHPSQRASAYCVLSFVSLSESNSFWKLLWSQPKLLLQTLPKSFQQ